MLELIINNVVESGYMSKFVVATSRKSGDDKMYNSCQKLEIYRYRGSNPDVLSKFKEISKEKSRIHGFDNFYPSISCYLEGYK